jgi:hypothetical protein
MPVLGFVDFDLVSAYWVLALAGTILFIIKMSLLLLGGHAGDASGLPGTDVHAGDAAHQTGSTFAVFSIQSVLAFFMGCGWMGLAAVKEWELGGTQSLLAAVGFGAFLMVLNAFLMSMLSHLTQEFTVELSTAVGHVAKVYLAIPEAGKGTGEVELTASGRKMVVTAKSVGPAIPSFAMVTVVEVLDEKMVVVAPRD